VKITKPFRAAISVAFVASLLAVPGCAQPAKKDNVAGLDEPSLAAADAAVQQLRQGRAFKDVAQEAARTPAERAVAGELQLYERGQQRRLPPELDAVIFASPLNQVLGPIAVQNVYYLFRVEKRMDPHQFTLEEVRPIIREQLRRQKLEQVEWPRWIRSQLANADIQVLEVESPQVGDESADPGLAQPAD